MESLQKRFSSFKRIVIFFLIFAFLVILAETLWDPSQQAWSMERIDPAPAAAMTAVIPAESSSDLP